jgi:hypothetical protein
VAFVKEKEELLRFHRHGSAARQAASRGTTVTLHTTIPSLPPLYSTTTTPTPPFTTPFHHRSTTVPPPFHHRSTTVPPPFHHRSTTVPPPFHHRSTTTTPPKPLHCTIPSLLSPFLLRGKTQTSLSLLTLELVRIVACCPLRFDARSLFEVFLVRIVLSSLAALNVCDTK